MHVARQFAEYIGCWWLMYTKVFVNVAFEPDPGNLASNKARTRNQASVFLLHTRMEGPLGPLSPPPPKHTIYLACFVVAEFSTHQPSLLVALRFFVVVLAVP